MDLINSWRFNVSGRIYSIINKLVIGRKVDSFSQEVREHGEYTNSCRHVPALQGCSLHKVLDSSFIVVI